MFLIVFINAPGSENRAMDSPQETAIRKVQGPDNVRTYGSFLVILTPVNVRSSGAARGIEYMCRLEFIEGPRKTD